MALFMISGSAHFVMNNIFEGMIWFFMPAVLVITNDIWAYICGVLFGRTQLIKLSPKKTVEGFVGAWIFTIFFGYLLTNALMRYKYFICPVNVCRFLLENNHLLTLSGPGREHTHRSFLHPQSRLHPSPLHPSSDRFLQSSYLSHRSYATPHLCFRNVRLPYSSLWRILRLWSQAYLQS